MGFKDLTPLRALPLYVVRCSLRVEQNQRGFVDFVYIFHFQHRLDGGVFRLFKDGIMVWASNAVAGAAAFLRRKMFLRVAGQKPTGASVGFA